MALNALTLSTTQGVQGRPFQAAISGLTTGRVEVLGDASPSFSVVNGNLMSRGLPYPVSTVSLREYEPGVGQGFRDTRIDITAVTRDQLLAQAQALLGPGRSLVRSRTAGERQSDGSIVYKLYAEDDLGATTVQFAGTSYLPNVSVAPYAAYGAKRMVQGYAGNLYTLKRVSDGALLNVAAAPGSDLPDYTAIASWAGQSAILVSSVYDQAGTGPVATWTTNANLPSFDLSQALAGAVPFLFDSIPGVGVGKFLRVNAALDRSALTIFDVVQPMTSANSATLWAIYGSGLRGALWTDSATPGLRFTGDSTGHNFGASAIPRANPSVIGLSAGLTNTKLYVRETEIVDTATQAQAINLLVIGGDQGTNATNAAAVRWGFVVYAAQLSSADAIAVRNALTRQFAIPTTFDSRIVFAGDSIMLGSGTTLVKNIVRQISFSGNPELFNVGIGGITVASINSRFSSFIAPLATTAYGSRSLMLQEGGTNDLAGGSSTASLQSAITTFVASSKAAGFKTGVGTIIPRLNSGLAANFETNRQAYNGWVTGGSSTGDFIFDSASEPHFAAANALTTASGLYGDEAQGSTGVFVHPNSLGSFYLAGVYAPAIRGALL